MVIINQYNSAELRGKIGPLLQSSWRPKTLIAWDLDNIFPRNVQGIQLLVDQLVCNHQRNPFERGQGSVLLSKARHTEVLIVANERSVERLKSQAEVENIDHLMRKIPGELVPTSSKRQSADLELKTRIIEFCENWKTQGRVFCVSNDAGFADILRYCSHSGVYTISVSTATMKYKRRPGLKPWRMHNKALRESSDAMIGIVQTPPGQEPSLLENLWSIEYIYESQAL